MATNIVEKGYLKAKRDQFTIFVACDFALGKSSKSDGKPKSSVDIKPQASDVKDELAKILRTTSENIRLYAQGAKGGLGKSAALTEVDDTIPFGDQGILNGSTVYFVLKRPDGSWEEPLIPSEESTT